jgi:hypothetical protein
MQDRPNRYLEQKPGGWFINKRLPGHLQDVFGTASVRRALHTQELEVARERRDQLLEILARGEPFESLLAGWKNAAETESVRAAPTDAPSGSIVVRDFPRTESARGAEEIEADCRRALERLDAMDSIITRLSQRLAALSATDAAGAAAAGRQHPLRAARG